MRIACFCTAFESKTKASFAACVQRNKHFICTFRAMHVTKCPLLIHNVESFIQAHKSRRYVYSILYSVIKFP